MIPSDPILPKQPNDAIKTNTLCICTFENGSTFHVPSLFAFYPDLNSILDVIRIALFLVQPNKIYSYYLGICF